MSASPSIEAYDAQMLDFSSDPDVPMHITGSAEFFAEALMDHDGHLSVSTYGEHASVEVDMEEYVGDDAEYEMADETAEYPRSHGDELLDIEVYDASHAPSPLPAPEPLQPSVDVPIDSEHPTSLTPAFSEHATLPELLDVPGSEVHPAPLDHPAADVLHVEPLASEEGASSEAVSLEPLHPTAESTLPVSESHEQLGETARANERPFETPAPADAADEAERIPVHPVAEEPPANSGEAQLETPEPPIAESAPLASAEEAFGDGPVIQDKRAADQVPATEGEAADPLHISDGVYIDPPPAVLLSIANLAKPEFVLFNQPDVEGESTGEPHGNREAYSLLLENQPTLYYESLSSVFEALRQDEALLSRVPHSFEGELFLDAFDLQLAVSEDNVHSREITLHDLNILHDGSNFVGPLRLLLRANVPRFIIRYYALQERIQRLNMAAETGEGEHDEEHHEEYDTGEERHLPQQEEVTNRSAAHASIVSESLEVAPTAQLEEPVKEPAYLAESTEEVPEENPQDTSGTQEPAAEYHEVTGEAARALQDEDDYEGANAGDEDESVNSESLDADQVHDTAAEDTDAAATVTGHGSEFGGEQSEYLDYVQPGEYDERYGEDLPEQAGGASSVQYGEPPHYEEEGEQDTSTAVDETQVILLGSDEDGEDKSAVTPAPTRAVLEPESSEPTGKFTDTAKQDDSNPSGEDLATSESMKQIIESKYASSNSSVRSPDEVLAEQTLGNHEPETAGEKIFSQVDESDSNFVSVLEREADAEFDQTFNAEQNGQESSVEATLQQESTWDEWDDEDAEGEDEEDWIDPDAVSNESSVTLSSKASSKRNYDEVDPSEAAYVEDPHTSPGSKRPRVQ
ncbi:hypothetical protein L210DRAFT_3764106 [Boletus edulis BED1]|uniref:Proteophosphoglycan ppg4 n=1 Tax=Boletus edulis BED1 TaxID=1328754 RepID=A0AAD4G9R9_BOLED|nr:hypothetical protein L210DRAFT_3764106 [Boletus edulis BED1]